MNARISRWQIKVQGCDFNVVYNKVLTNIADYNIGQKVGDKLINISKIGFSMKRFTADVLQFFTKKCQNLDFGWTAGSLSPNPSISGTFLKFPNFLIS